ncbi:SRPBCC family protein [Actinoplanes sp. NPDC051859]|uniref:SRPBCC family protein n=1 Tax=Actinoplanes sp. NPDC051859 TaxID=3363909 RepID=UPI0037A092A2
MIQVKQQISAVRRTLGSRQLEAGEAKVATITQVYDTDIDDLWEAVTSAGRIPRWFMPITGDLREGGTYQLQGNAGGTITRCERPTSFAATWEYNNEVSWIEVRLTAEGAERTRFELEHVAHVSAELWEKYGPAATGLGWDLGIMGLSLHLANPDTALKPEDGPAWMQSPEGLEFMRLSADAWVDAAIASGDDPTQARASADRTFAAYTGAES